jgi:hypothetical protein
MNNSNYQLYDVLNYYEEIKNTKYELTNKYFSLIIEYLKNINHLDNNISYKGLNTITNVFTLLLYYTKNIELTFYHAQKSFYFYIEFIQQITQDKNTFLNLSSKDASIFVYKKTIFEINNDIKKNIIAISDEDSEKIEYLNSYISIIKNVFSSLTENKDEFIKNINKYLSNATLKQLENIVLFQNQLNEIDSKKYTELLQLFIKKNGNNNQFIINEEFKNKLELDSPVKFIKWLFSG